MRHLHAATALFRIACIATARVLVVALLCLAVAKWLGEGFEFAAVYVATAIAIDAHIRLEILKEESDDRR